MGGGDSPPGERKVSFIDRKTGMAPYSDPSKFASRRSTHSATGGCSAGLKSRQGRGGSKGNSCATRCRARSSAWPREPRRHPRRTRGYASGLPERAEELLGHRPANEAQRPADGAKQEAVRLLRLVGGAIPARQGPERILPEDHTPQRFGEAAIKSVNVA